jgi:hypothetical protein
MATESGVSRVCDAPLEDSDARRVPERYRSLPEPVRAEDMITEQPSQDPPDPEGGRDTERDFMLRYAG